MTYKAHIENGTIVLDEPIDLPNGTALQVEPVRQQRTRTLAERFKDIIGVADDLPADMAENHDHYLHGAPKR